MRKQRSNARDGIHASGIRYAIWGLPTSFLNDGCPSILSFFGCPRNLDRNCDTRDVGGLRSRVNTDAIWGKTLTSPRKTAGWVLGNILTCLRLLRLGNSVFSLWSIQEAGVSLRLPRWRRWKRSLLHYRKRTSRIISRRYGRSPGRSAFSFLW